MLSRCRIATLTLALCPAHIGKGGVAEPIGPMTTGPVTCESPNEAISITFAVAEGVRLRKTFTRELELTTLQSDSLVELGRWDDSQRIVLIDEYGALRGQVPETISRSFVRIAMEHSHDWEISMPWIESLSGTVQRKGTGALVGSSVTFVRDHTESQIPFGTHEANYTAQLLDDPAPTDEAAASIAALRASTDSTGLLPWRKIAIGEHWFVDVDAFHEICWPSGALEFIDSDDEPLVTPLDERLGQDLDGTFRVELGAVETVSGVRYARLDFRGILESRSTFDYEWFFDVLGQDLSYEGPITLGLYASLQGRAWWNLDGGHLDSIHIEGNITVDQEFGEAEWDQWDLWRGFLSDVFCTRVWHGKLRADAHYERL